MQRHLYYYTHVEATPSTARELFRADPALWLPAPAEAHADHWVVELAADGALPSAIARHHVQVEVGAPFPSQGRVLRSLTWRSASAPGIFPVFTGDIELIALQGSLCQLSLMGTYRPPLSVAGDAADAIHGHHVAEACVRRFVLDVGARMAGVTLNA